MEIEAFSMEFFSLRGKTALVTGGNSGLGLAFSAAMAKAGANLFIPTVEPDTAEAAALYEAAGVQAVFMQTDLTRAGAPQAAVRQCVESFGSVDILVNCAGIIRRGSIDTFTREDWDSMVDVNLSVPFEMSRAAAPYMTAQHSGKIINICSMYSFLGYANSAAYTATKHGIAGLTKALCDDLGPHNIQCNGIAPGFFATKVTEQSRSVPGRVEAIQAHTPAGRWGDPADLMGAAVFLASRASDFVNGQILAVDGGFLVR